MDKLPVAKNISRGLSKNILLVDEQSDSFEIIEKKLKDTDYNLYSIKDIAKVEQLTSERDFDLILISYSFIAGKKGKYNIIKKINVVQPHTPIVALCGVPSVQIIVDFLRAGAYDILLKPIDPDEFFEMFQRAILQKSNSIRDYNERKRLEFVAESANLMENIGFIFSGVRHELGNPINAIKMTLSVLLDGLRKLSLEELEELIVRAQKDIGRVEFLLNSLKNFSLFEDFVPEQFEIREFFVKFDRLVKGDLEKRGINFKIILGDELTGLDAYLDPRVLQQILLNLVFNAAEAKDVRKEEPEIALFVDVTEDGMILIEVNDNGIGIPKDDMKHLFQPFFTTKRQGSGLGLVIVKKMLAKSKGTIEVESIEGVGTKMRILVPLGE